MGSVGNISCNSVIHGEHMAAASSNRRAQNSRADSGLNYLPLTPSVLPQSGTSLALQHKWQTRGYMLQRHDVVNEDEGDTPVL